MSERGEHCPIERPNKEIAQIFFGFLSHISFGVQKMGLFNTGSWAEGAIAVSQRSTYEWDCDSFTDDLHKLINNRSRPALLYI
jgi:hypothetical protein